MHPTATRRPKSRPGRLPRDKRPGQNPKRYMLTSVHRMGPAINNPVRGVFMRAGIRGRWLTFQGVARETTGVETDSADGEYKTMIQKAASP